MKVREKRIVIVFFLLLPPPPILPIQYAIVSMALRGPRTP